MNSNSKKELLVFIISIVLIALGLALNERTVTYFFTFDNQLATEARIFVWIVDIALIAIGFYGLLKRRQLAQHISLTRQGILAVVFIAALILGGLEISARVLDRMNNYNFTTERRKEGSIIPFRVFGPTYHTYQGGELHITDTYGNTYPFEKSNDTYRIVVFGGSTTVQNFDGIHYPLLVENRLEEVYPNMNFELINVSHSAYSTAHSLIALTLNALSWDADAVILSHNINDLKAAYFPNFTPNYANKYSHDFYTKPDKLTCGLCPLYEWSTLYWVAEQQFQAFAFKQSIGEGFYNRKSYGMEPPELAQRAFRRNLEEFVETAQDNGMRAVLGTQPLQPSREYFDRGSRFKPYNDIVEYPEHEEYVAHHGRFNEIIREVANEQNAVLVENDRYFDGDKEYFIDNVHYTEAGLRRLAENYYDTITASDLTR